MKKLNIVVLTVLLSLPVLSFGATEEFEFLGSRLTVKSSSQKELKAFVVSINKNKDSFLKGLDNDCMYKDARTEECRVEIDYALKTKIKIKEIVSEGKKNYRLAFLANNIETNKNSILNGLSIIEDSRASVLKPWQMNYFGQLFQSKGSKKEIHISSPLMPLVSFASVPSYEGWAISQISEVASGAKVVKGKKSIRSDFLKIILFGKPEFSGARLYGWSKALMVGGKKLLKKLEKNKAYKNQWGYMYFDQNANLVCSKNIDCKFSSMTKRQLKVRW